MMELNEKDYDPEVVTFKKMQARVILEEPG